MALLEVRALRASFATDDGDLVAVDGVSFDVEAGSTLALAGDQTFGTLSGSGALALGGFTLATGSGGARVNPAAMPSKRFFKSRVCYAAARVPNIQRIVIAPAKQNVVVSRKSKAMNRGRMFTELPGLSRFVWFLTGL